MGLVLSRYLMESVFIGPDIQVQIVEIRGKDGRPKVRLNITAPGKKILREELIHPGEKWDLREREAG